ncbi:SDR family NAD(P)-dependent oxidoreductase [Rhodococcus sp. B50]|uniref:SDR family NAD(P)-dependent oxidoreductase n=1 Tax=Rhodococcus sp. B50 TaxID=2682847 RepID=UPI001BD3C167|nr:SDR family NAD(P)-dependent oxidoreductase [Rhodococcus sp. B50]MBS9375042.1 Gluconate 5-dehydrogenase [Rhodococcus sp. B50]
MPEYALPNFSIDLSGNVALVTGATSGLGRRFARVIADAGAAVAIAGRREDRLKELQQEIETAGGTCVATTVDVTDADALVSAVDQVESALGMVTMLVNCAGIPDARRAHRMSLGLVDAVIDTNLRAPFLLSTEVARRLIAAGKPGRIVNISSIGAYNYSGNGAALYSMTKAAVNRMTETLAVEWVEQNINVNAIAPGAFDTEMVAGMIERVGDFSPSLPRKRIGHVAQLDSTLLYLLSPSSDFVTGTIIKVDDGQHPR